MPAAISLSLALAARDAGLATAPADNDPLRLDLPPDQVDGDELDPRAAAALGALYLASELAAIGVVACAELLAQGRWELGVRDPATVRALEGFARRSVLRPDARVRSALFSRLFGAPTESAGSQSEPVANHAFEELLAGYCQAIVSVRDRSVRGSAPALRLAGDRIRRNLAARQYGNTLLVASDLVAQVREALDLLALAEVGALFGVRGVWSVVRVMHGGQPPDIGRHVDRATSGRIVVASTGYPPVPDLVDSALAEAAASWLAATGFELEVRGG